MNFTNPLQILLKNLYKILKKYKFLIRIIVNKNLTSLILKKHVKIPSIKQIIFIIKKINQIYYPLN